MESTFAEVVGGIRKEQKEGSRCQSWRHGVLEFGKSTGVLESTKPISRSHEE